MKALHSFTLDPTAAGEIKKIKKGKKSGFVSDAIVKYAKWKSWHISIDRSKVPEDMRFYQMTELLEKYNDKCIQVQELTKELNQIRQASKPKQSLISRLFLSNGE
jgi:hypothetical protein